MDIGRKNLSVNNGEEIVNKDKNTGNIISIFLNTLSGKVRQVLSWKNNLQKIPTQNSIKLRIYNINKLRKLGKEKDAKDAIEELKTLIELSRLLSTSIIKDIELGINHCFENNLPIKNLNNLEVYKNAIRRIEALPLEYLEYFEFQLKSLINDIIAKEDLLKQGKSSVIDILFPELNGIRLNDVGIESSQLAIELFPKSQYSFEKLHGPKDGESINGVCMYKKGKQVNLYSPKRRPGDSTIKHERQHNRYNTLSLSESILNIENELKKNKNLNYGEFLNKSIKSLQKAYNVALEMAKDEILARWVGGDDVWNTEKVTSYEHVNEISGDGFKMYIEDDNSGYGLYDFVEDLEKYILETLEKKKSEFKKQLIDKGATQSDIDIIFLNFPKIDELIKKGHKQYNEIIGNLVTYIFRSKNQEDIDLITITPIKYLNFKGKKIVIL